MAIRQGGLCNWLVMYLGCFPQGDHLSEGKDGVEPQRAEWRDRFDGAMRSCVYSFVKERKAGKYE